MQSWSQSYRSNCFVVTKIFLKPQSIFTLLTKIYFQLRRNNFYRTDPWTNVKKLGTNLTKCRFLLTFVGLSGPSCERVSTNFTIPTFGHILPLVCRCLSMFVYVCLCLSMFVYVCLRLSTFVVVFMFVKVHQDTRPCSYFILVVSSPIW